MEEKKKYFRRLDILRDLSCILVLLYHLNILQGGFLAVCTFFVLSGYLSYMSIYKDEKFSIKEYYIKRLKKLYLPLIVVVAITVAVTKVLPNINWINLKPETFSVLFGYNNIWQLNASLDYFTRNVNSPFIHMWYISILLQFDLVFPLFVLLLRKICRNAKKNIYALIMFLFTAVTTCMFLNMSKTHDIMEVYYHTFARSFSIFFGITLSMIHYRYNFNVSKYLRRFHTPIFVIYLIILIILCIFVPAKSENYAIYMIITTIISTRLITYSTDESIRKTKFDNYIKAISKVSYEIYLVQYPIIFFMQKLAINDILKNMIIIVSTLLISMILHILIYYPVKRKIFRDLKALILSTIIVLGGFVLITSKDYSAEMKALENKIAENAKIAEERNKEFLNNDEKTEEKVWKKIEDENEKEKEEIVEQKEEEKQEERQEEKETEKEDIDEEEIAEKVKNMKVVGIGDSILLTAIDDLYDQFPNGYFDGKISRSLYKAEEIAKDLKQKGKLSDTLILFLATNGDYSNKINKDFMDIVGDRQVYWVEAAGPDDPQFNEKFREFAKDYSNIHIVEWVKETKEHPEYLEPDKIHPNYKGSKKMVELIYNTICNDYLNK